MIAKVELKTDQEKNTLLIAFFGTLEKASLSKKSLFDKMLILIKT